MTFELQLARGTAGKSLTVDSRLILWRQGRRDIVTNYMTEQDVRHMRDAILAENPRLDAIAGRWDGGHRIYMAIADHRAGA